MDPTQDPPSEEAARWARLMSDDTYGIDRDIDELVRLLRARHGYPRQTANAELVRRLALPARTMSGARLPR